MSTETEPQQHTSTSPAKWIAVLWMLLAATCFVLSFSLLHTVGGTGGIVTGIAVTCVVTWTLAWRRSHSYRRQLRTAAWAMTVAMMVWSGTSFAKYVLHDNGDTIEQRISAWGRNHNLGFIINKLEQYVYADPPSKEPAKALVLAAPVVTAPPTTEPEPEAVTTTTIPEPEEPAALTPFFPQPLPGEGAWTPVAVADGHVSMWATSMRPLPEFGGVVASMVVIDQTYVRAGMFNGDEEPGGTWIRDSKVPPELHPSLLAVMNGGFRMEQMEGGYKTEGRVVKELIVGRATLAVDHAGHMTVGEYGRDLFDDGTWITLRQNLVLLVDNGVPGIERAKREKIYWGAELDGTMYVNRSAACILNEGRLAYVMAGKVDGPQFADALINLGCRTAIQLDVNGAWPTFMLYEHGADGSLIPHPLDKRMNINPQRYVNGASKEFFAFFDASLVPGPSVLDA